MHIIYCYIEMVSRYENLNHGRGTKSLMGQEVQKNQSNYGNTSCFVAQAKKKILYRSLSAVLEKSGNRDMLGSNYLPKVTQ